MNAVVVKAPERWEHTSDHRPTLFLSGEIDMGNAVNWQERATRFLGDLPICILNPRRDDWDSSWVQSIENAQFREQVGWELTGLEVADVVLVHFPHASAAPITLMELGLLVGMKPKHTVVSCELGYHRRGNVEVVCDRYGIRLYETLTSAMLDAAHLLGRAWDPPGDPG